MASFNRSRGHNSGVSRRAVMYAASALPVGALVVCAAAAPPKTSKAPAKPATKAAAGSFEREVLPFVSKYCLACHSGDTPSAGVSLSDYKTGEQALKARNLWDKVATSVSSKHMPPKGMPQPTDAERNAVVGWLQSAISKADCDLKQPGRVTLRRLNRSEYNNTVRDLCGVSITPADDFPSDDVGYGFDNIGDVLSISPLLMEKYMTAARKVARAAIVAPEDRIPATPKKYPASKLQGDGGEYSGTNGHILFSNGKAYIEHEFPGPGKYEIRVEAFEQHAGPEVARMTVAVGLNRLRTVGVRAREGNPGQYPGTVEIETAGRKQVSITFENDYYDDKSEDPKLKGDRNLIIQSIEIIPQGVSIAPPEKPASHTRLISMMPADNSEAAMNAATRTVLTPFLKRAFRRPATKAEVDRYVGIAARTRAMGLSYERSIQVAVQAALVSPHFLFMIEPDPTNAKGSRPLNDYELATRLAYFLWSSQPDDQLLSLADKGKLKDPAVLVAQAKRMIKDPKAKALADNFAGQWLQYRKMQVVTPDPKAFPTFNESLRNAMRTETQMFFQHIVTQDRPITEFLSADYTFLNEPLAKHYGNESVKGDEFRLVKLPSKERGGLLSQASVLTITSNPNRTSPVKRGKWVLENILGAPPPPPPPNVPELADDNAEKKGQLTGTLRQRMEQHRSNPACASCHQAMDSIGFGMENFDAIGAWRVKDGNDNIDPSGTMPDGKTINGVTGLKTYLMGKKGQFTRALTEKMLTYALGRGVEPYDNCNLDAMAAAIAKKEYRFSALVEAVVTSEPFRFRTVGTRSPMKPTPKTPTPTKKPSKAAAAGKREVAQR